MTSEYPDRQRLHLSRPRAILYLTALFFTLLAVTSALAAGQTLSVSPTSGEPGTTIAVSGKNWTFDNPKYPIFLDSVGGTQLGDFSPGKDGSWSTKVTIPGRTSTGDHKIIACEGYGTKTQFCTATAFKVTSPPPPTKPPTPTYTKQPTSITPTFTPSPTAKPPTQRPPTQRNTDTPVPVGVPETGDSPLEPPRCTDLAMEPETLVIDFDGPGGPGLNPDAWYSYSYGVSFDGSAEIAVPGVATISGSKALKSVETGEFGSTGVNLRIVFSRGVQSIGMFLGMDGAPYTIGEVTAALYVYGYRGGAGEISELGYRVVTFPAGYTDIEYCLAYVGREADLISHAELDYLNSEDIPIGEPKLLDNLTLVYSAQELPADAPPEVTIIQPETGTEFSGGTVEVRIDVTEDRRLEGMWYELNGGPPVNLAMIPGEDPDLYHAVFWLAAESLTPDATNTIEVFARDSSGQEGSDSIDLFYNLPASLDLRIDRVESTQVIQTMHNLFPVLDNSMPLFYGKPTLVRAYLRADGTEVDIPGISGQLCLDGDCILADSPVTVSPVDDPVADFRGDLSRTLNFLLPQEWVEDEGLVTLMLTINVDGADVEECCYPNNVRMVSFSLQRGRQLNVAMQRVNAHGFSTTAADRWPAIQWTLRNYPTQRVSVFFTTDEPLNLDFDYTTDAGWEAALTEVWWSNFFTDDPAHDLYYQAMIPDGVSFSSTGIGYRPGAESAAIWMALEGATTAHELGHNMNLRHAPSDTDAAGNVNNPACQDPENVDNGYPQYFAPNGNSYHRSSIGDWGIDLYASPWELKDPASTYDLMSYCSPSWMSLTTYPYLQERIGWYALTELTQIVSNNSLFFPTNSEVEYLVGGGRISPEGFELTRGFFVQPLPTDVQPPPDGGPFSVQLLDIDGAILNQRAFTLMTTDLAEDSPEGQFVVMIPYVPGTSDVIFLYQNKELGSVKVSEHSPQIRLLSPNGGESWAAAGEEIIRWEAADRDGDPLTSYIQYSPDGGESWRAVELNITEMEYTVDTSVLPGSSNARMRVCTTDGVNTACDESYEPFQVEGKGPQIFISSPGDGMEFSRGEDVIFEALATDVEDGPIEKSQDFTWTSDKDGLLAKDYLFWGQPLSSGRHTITLTVSDSDGNQNSESVSIVILSAETIVAEPDEEIIIPETGEESQGLKLTPLQIALGLIFLGFFALVLVGLVIYILRLKRRQAGRGG